MGFSLISTAEIFYHCFVGLFTGKCWPTEEMSIRNNPEHRKEMCRNVNNDIAYYPNETDCSDWDNDGGFTEDEQHGSAPSFGAYCDTWVSPLLQDEQQEYEYQTNFRNTSQVCDWRIMLQT